MAEGPLSCDEWKAMGRSLMERTDLKETRELVLSAMKSCIENGSEGPKLMRDVLRPVADFIEKSEGDGDETVIVALSAMAFAIAQLTRIVGDAVPNLREIAAIQLMTSLGKVAREAK